MAKNKPIPPFNFHCLHCGRVHAVLFVGSGEKSFSCRHCQQSFTICVLEVKEVADTYAVEISTVSYLGKESTRVRQEKSRPAN